MPKLEWEYDRDYNKFAMYNGYRIRTEFDQAHANPFEEDDGNWPISVRLPDRRSSDFKDYDATGQTHETRNPLARFGDTMLIHMQVHIAKVLGTTVRDAMQSWFDTVGNDGVEVHGYCTDAALLRDVLNHVFDQDIEDGDLFDVCVALYKLLDIPAYTQQVNGCCQGDWAEVLVVAPPEIVEKFGCITPITDEVLKSTAELYGYWAFGDTWAYVIERPIEVDEDGDVTEWEQIEDGCGGTYFGSDHDESGLTEGALDAVPDEAPEMPAYEGELEDA